MRPGQLRLKTYRTRRPDPAVRSGAGAREFRLPGARGNADRARRQTLGYIHDFRSRSAPRPTSDAILARAGEIEEAIADVLCGAAEDDEFNQLVFTPGSTPQPVVWLRAWFRYLRQTGSSFGLVTVVDALRRAPGRDPRAGRAVRRRARPVGGQQARTAGRPARDGLRSRRCAKVRSIDDDRILRRLRALVDAIVADQRLRSGGERSARVQDRFSAGPGASGAGAVARNLGLFAARRGHPLARRPDRPRRPALVRPARRFPHRDPRPDEGADGQECGDRPDRRQGRLLSQAAARRRRNRDAWLAEGTESYRIFIRSLLSVTDNIVNDKVVHPDRRGHPRRRRSLFRGRRRQGHRDLLRRRQCASRSSAISGSATPSPAAARNGYDHKAMGITAKGAWISVQRHFLEMGIDVQSDPVTVAGCGDMSGDVFGNGMLLSKSIKLVAAFDHRHIFIDPDPDPATSWAERKRMFELPRSSWDDYDRKLMSKGGGDLPAHPEVDRAQLGSARGARHRGQRRSTRRRLINAILKSPVDLLWFGGIGTYIKASSQSQRRCRRPGQRRAPRRRRRAPRQGDRRRRQPRHHPGRADRVRRAWRADQHRLHRQ